MSEDANVRQAVPFFLVSLADPDGYRLDFESLTDVPE
jgi:hypothetical protein